MIHDDDGDQAPLQGAPRLQSKTHPRIEATAPLARGLVRTACAIWGLPDEVTEAAAVVMAELVSNAVRHAPGPSVRVTVDRLGDDRVRLAVVDRSPHRLPGLRTPQDEELSGRGLVLVEAMSDRGATTGSAPLVARGASAAGQNSP